MTVKPPQVFENGIGARTKRVEDHRLLRGQGQFVGDIKLPGMLEVAFVRSPVAHARIKQIEKPQPPAGQYVFAMSDLVGIKPILATSGLEGFQVSEQHPMATDKVRHVGEIVAMCIAPTRSQAEDLAESVFVDYEELPTLVDMFDAVSPATQTRVHEHWKENVFLRTHVVKNRPVSGPDITKVSRLLRTSRQCMAPIEGRAVLCHFDTRLDQLVVWSANQQPHINRTGIAECLSLPEEKVRVISPDVGGGFGYKAILLPEEICCSWATMQLRLPIRWLEDRREHLSANANCREHAYDISVSVDREGTLLGIECDAIVDSGAYSSYPFTACLEAAQIGSILPGPYQMSFFDCHTRSAATNKPPILPYRGVARTGVCFALEVMIDIAARELGIEPHEVRRKSLVRSNQMPYTNITGKLFDSGDYVQCLDRALVAFGWDQWREKQRLHHVANPQKRLGIGIGIFCEQGAHGTSVYHGWGIPMVPGFEQCHVRMTPDGGLEIHIGVHSHGQSMETTFAQIANSVLGIPVSRVRIRHGDTANTPYSTGTWGSRSAVMAGGAVGTACDALAKRLIKIAAHMLKEPEDRVHLMHDAAMTLDGAKRLALSEIARTWYRAPQNLPADVDPEGLMLTAGYRMTPDSGTFSYACHVCAVELDTVTGFTKLLEYAVCEDGGTLINPMVVEGQLLGGIAQGVGTALLEEMPFDENGQPLATTLADYMLPSADDLPPIKIEHMCTPSPFSKYGQKGIGEGGAIAPPATIINAINDALAGLGAQILMLPASPQRIRQAIRAAQETA